MLQGSHSFASLRWEIEVDGWDPDVLTLAVISSEVDAMPVGDICKYWAAETFASVQPKIQAARQWSSP